MTIGEGHLKIVRPAPPRVRRRPIDAFLQSLAADQGENAIGIILSGIGSDGAKGLAAVKEHGGLTLAQAEYDSHTLPGMGADDEVRVWCRAARPERKPICAASIRLRGKRLSALHVLGQAREPNGG